MSSNKLRTTRQYREWRSKVFERDNFTCQECGNTNNLEAHHLKEISKYPQLIYEVDNGITLCHECHIKTPSYFYYPHPNKNINSIKENEVRKTIIVNDNVAEMLSQIAKKLEITENSVISVAILEYYNKVRGAL